MCLPCEKAVPNFLIMCPWPKPLTYIWKKSSDWPILHVCTLWSELSICSKKKLTFHLHLKNSNICQFFCTINGRIKLSVIWEKKVLYITIYQKSLHPINNARKRGTTILWICLSSSCHTYHFNVQQLQRWLAKNLGLGGLCRLRNCFIPSPNKFMRALLIQHVSSSLFSHRFVDWSISALQTLIFWSTMMIFQLYYAQDMRWTTTALRTKSSILRVWTV